MNPDDIRKLQNKIKKEHFERQKSRHLVNLEYIRDFILGDENNQPQVTYIPKIMEFNKLYEQMKKWIEESYNKDKDE